MGVEREVMTSKRCPHLVRHGKVGKGNAIEFTNLCALKRAEMDPCSLEEDDKTDYRLCGTYKSLFQPAYEKNGVRLNENTDLETRFGDTKSISDMELL